jgi:DNA-binding transcriptional LysR family regulator
LAAAEVDLANVGGAIRGTVRVASVPTLGRALLPAVVAAVRARAPELEIVVDQLEPEQSLPALARGEYDLAIAGEYGLAPRRLEASIERIDLFAEPVLIAVPTDHPAGGLTVRLGDLRDDRWIAPAAGSSCAVLLERSCAIAGYEPLTVGQVADFEMAAALVAVGHGVALIPASACFGQSGVRLLTSTEPEIHRTLYAAVRAGTAAHPAIVCLLEALRPTAP